ncbi:hypothetical protein L484_001249 [Morus notabilis]|uniref:Uncharacterized protein n=1 Tax=Morus notabilis TaxID=981085 RepID=W9SQ56_9ROSA|nr:hypothetical protein L484_001249 [Morus notabilis]
MGHFPSSMIKLAYIAMTQEMRQQPQAFTIVPFQTSVIKCGLLPSILCASLDCIHMHKFRSSVQIKLSPTFPRLRASSSNGCKLRIYKIRKLA